MQTVDRTLKLEDMNVCVGQAMKGMGITVDLEVKDEKDTVYYNREM